jgi:hypothetical protein
MANVEVYNGESTPKTASFTSLSVTFSNPQLTIYNGSGATIGSGANSCANNSVCQLTPSTTPLTLTFFTSPFPFTWSSTESLSFLLDIHLDTVIQPDLTVNLAAPDGVTISQLPIPSSGAPISGLGELTGTIQSIIPAVNSLNLDGFTLQTASGRTFTIDVNNSTSYNDFPRSACSTGAYSCLAPQQIVKVALSLPPGGAPLLASEVDYVQPAGLTVVEGNIIGLRFLGGSTIMEIIPQQGSATANTLPDGQMVTVTVPPTGVTYAIDSGSFTLPSGLSFTVASDLMVGQQVSVVVVPGSVATASGSSSSTSVVAPAATTFTTNSITLEPSQITGSVNGAFPINVSGLSFVLSTYPNYFVPPAATSSAPPVPVSVNLTVQATPATIFTNLTPDSISGLSVGEVVSVKGWLFPYPAIPLDCIGVGGCAPIGEIAAEAVVGRPGPTPLF